MIFDAHSHIGHDWMMSESTIEAYHSVLNSNDICGGILMPEPGHINRETKKRYMMWNFNESGEFYYYSPHGSTDSKEFLSNTTALINDDIYDRICHYKTNKKIYYCAMINPIIDDLDFYDKMRARYGCVALKLHGIAGGYGPHMIGEEQIYKIKQTGLPLIIHTDYSRTTGDPLSNIRNMNNPRAWFDFLQSNNLKGYLCHGCRLDIELLKDISVSENVIVGIGPDWAIQQDTNRIVNLNLNEFSYLDLMLKFLSPKKMAFDIDYNYLEGDREFVTRIGNVLSQDRIVYNKVMAQNAADFFGLKLR